MTGAAKEVPAPTCPCGQCDGSGLSWDEAWNEWHCVASGAEYAAEEVEPWSSALNLVTRTARVIADYFDMDEPDRSTRQMAAFIVARAFTSCPKTGGVGAPVASQDRGGRDGRPVPPCCRYCGEPGGDCGYVCC